MKIPFYLLLIVLYVGCTTAPKPEKKSVSHADENTVELTAELTHISFPIEGMTCEVGCAARIEKKVAVAEGIASSKVDFEGKTAYVSFDPTKTSFDAIRATIEGLGTDYSVGEAQANSDYKLKEEGKACSKECTKPCCKDKKDADKKACPADCKKACCVKKEVKA